MSQNSLGLGCISFITCVIKYLPPELRVTSVNLDDLTAVFYKEQRPISHLYKTLKTVSSLGTFNIKPKPIPLLK